MDAQPPGWCDHGIGSPAHGSLVVIHHGIDGLVLSGLHAPGITGEHMVEGGTQLLVVLLDPRDLRGEVYPAVLPVDTTPQIVGGDALLGRGVIGAIVEYLRVERGAHILGLQAEATHQGEASAQDVGVIEEAFIEVVDNHARLFEVKACTTSVGLGHIVGRIAIHVEEFQSQTSLEPQAIVHGPFIGQKTEELMLMPVVELGIGIVGIAFLAVVKQQQRVGFHLMGEHIGRGLRAAMIQPIVHLGCPTVALVPTGTCKLGIGHPRVLEGIEAQHAAGLSPAYELGTVFVAETSACSSIGHAHHGGIGAV